jgi:hypothetical protein
VEAEPAAWGAGSVEARGGTQCEEGVDRMVERQPTYESIVRLGPTRFGMTVRLADGTSVVHELGRRVGLDRGSEPRQ